jgi:hypothetical protein
MYYYSIIFNKLKSIKIVLFIAYIVLFFFFLTFKSDFDNIVIDNLI